MILTGFKRNDQVDAVLFICRISDIGYSVIANLSTIQYCTAVLYSDVKE